MSYEHSSNSMMGAEGFGSDSVQDTGSGVSATHGGVSGAVNFGFLRKHDPKDRKTQLELGSEKEKLKAMKAIMVEVARGGDQSELFPSIVKLVVCKSLELKKLVYMYLVRFAEDCPDEALLAVSTFQKGLKDPNQLIRASALRVLSSIRVPVIVPIVLISLKQAATDMSPYVRKTAAHAIPKVFNLVPSEKDSLLEVLEKLLHDRTTLVLGSALMAFDEICPDRLDLLHKHFRKICQMLIDIDEWGQMAVLAILTRYARTQFLDPNQGELVPKAEKFYASSESEESEEEEEEGTDEEDEESGDEKAKKKKQYEMDPDHRLLLRSALPLLYSRNPGVVQAVAQLYHYLAPHNEMNLVAKPMIRMLRGPNEVQHLLLGTVVTIIQTRPTLFEPYLKSFFVSSTDTRAIKLLKLEILTLLASESNVSIVLREFQEYVRADDKTFVTSTIQCIGRCASTLPNVRESCLSGLVALMSNRNEAVVAESVVVIKKLLQMNPASHADIIKSMAKMATSIAVPMARASILWLIGEYSSIVPKIAPDVLRQMAKTFGKEEDIVKLQILNLAAKLFLTIPKQSKLLATYVLNLAKYDQNYDLRDRARFIRALLFNKESKLYKHAKTFFLSEKPAPNLVSMFADRDRFQVGTISHVLNYECIGLMPLPGFPEEAPDPSVRVVEEVKTWETNGALLAGAEAKESGYFFTDDEETDSESTSGSDSDSGSSSSGSESGSASDSGSSDSESSESEEEESGPDSRAGSSDEEDGEDSRKGSSSESESDSDSDDSRNGSDSDGDDAAPTKAAAPKGASTAEPSLLDIDFGGATTTTAAAAAAAAPPSNAGLLDGLTLQPSSSTGSFKAGAGVQVEAKSYELLNRLNAKGLGADYTFGRHASMHGDNMVAVGVTFVNSSGGAISNINVSQTPEGDVKLVAFPPIEALAAGESRQVSVAVDFNDTIKPATFEISATFDGEPDSFKVNIEAPVGELVRPVDLTLAQFDEECSKLGGMHESAADVEVGEGTDIVNNVAKLANVAVVNQTAPRWCFAGQTISSKELVLIGINTETNRVTVNCGKMIIGSNLLKSLKAALAAE